MDNEKEVYCKCGKEMILAPGLDYYCPDPLCKIQHNEFLESLREANKRSHAMKYPGVAVGVLIFNDKGQILLGKRKGELGTGEYSLPGGKVDFGETPYQAVLREVKEETNLDLKGAIFARQVTNDYFPDSGKHYITLYYISTILGNFQELKVMEPDKIESWEWYNPLDTPQPCWMHTGELIKSIIKDGLLKTIDIDG